MVFVKVVKTKAYFSRFQTKFRRRRTGQTDYQARHKLVAQDRTKFNTRKYRLIVRFSNRDVTAQVAYATIAGDVVVAAAYSHELTRYGAKVGLTNHAAAYATCLLLGRRLLKLLNLDDKYAGNTGAIGEDYNVEENEEGPGPFMCILDTGLRRTSTGARLFTALKGALDAGLDIPHSETRFVGYDSEASTLSTETLRKVIFGGNVADYMRLLKEENPERYATQFARYIKAGVGADDIEPMWTKVHAAIRANPDAVKAAPVSDEKKKRTNPKRRSLAQRKDRVRQKIASANKRLAERIAAGGGGDEAPAADDDDDE